MRNASPSLLTALLLALPGLACEADGGEQSSEGSSGTSNPATTDDPGNTSAPPPATTTTGVPMTSSSGAVDSSGSSDETADPPLFDLGELPDMPKVDPPKEEFDCNDIPDEYVSVSVIPNARGYHGLAITPDGLILGSDGSSLIESDYLGDWGVFIPGIGSGQQMDWLADGDLAYATSDGAISRIRLDGTYEVMTPSVNAYGVTRGPDDLVYVVPNAGDDVRRIDPDTGEIEILFDYPFGGSAHSMGFSPDGRRIYIGTIGTGSVYYIDLSASMEPIGDVTLLSNEVTEAGGAFGGWHDAVAVDACGNLYVPDYSSRNLYRIGPDGTTDLYWEAPSADYAHGLIWGSGEHGWRRDALYFPKPYDGNTVGEIVIGAPPRDFGGVVLNATPML